MSVIIAQGKARVKIVEGVSREVIPFVGADRQGLLASFGVGYRIVNQRGGTIWGLVMPHLLIQSWRAMKLLECIPVIDRGTLCGCWYAAGEKMHEGNRHYVDDLARQFEERLQVEKMRASVLKLLPSEAELSAMLICLRNHKIEVSVDEMSDLINRGQLLPHPLVDELIKEDEARRRELAEHMALVHAAMPQEESLSALFADLGIDNMIDGAPFGGYGLDWGHIKLNELDTYVKRFTTGRYGKGHYFELRRTNPYTNTAQLDGKIPQYQTYFGVVEEPWFLARDGTKFTFRRARYHNGSIAVEVNSRHPNGDLCHKELSVPEIRKVLGPLPKYKKRWLIRH